MNEATAIRRVEAMTYPPAHKHLILHKVKAAQTDEIRQEIVEKAQRELGSATSGYQTKIGNIPDTL